MVSLEIDETSTVLNVTHLPLRELGTDVSFPDLGKEDKYLGRRR